MKKVIYGGLFLALVGIGFVSCKKENTAPEDQQSTNQTIDKDKYFGDSKTKEKDGGDPLFTLENGGNYLIFRTEAGYTTAIDNPDETTYGKLLTRIAELNFTSHFDNVKNNPDLASSDPFKLGDLLARMINTNHIVQIGNYLFKIEPTIEKVFTLHEDDVATGYTDLVNMNTLNPDVLSFSTNIEVIEALKEGGEKGIFCNDATASAKSTTSNTVYFQSSNLSNQQTENFYGTSYYRTFGVWFILGTNTNFSLFGNGSGNYGHWIQMDNCSYAQRCGSSVSNYSHPWRGMIAGQYAFSGGEKIFRWYSGLKRLKSYNLKTRVRCENPNIPQGGNPYTTYFTNYMQIVS